MTAKNPQFKTVTPSNYRPTINSEICVKCKVCMTKCPRDAISYVESEDKMEINYEPCIGCGLCVSNCKKGAMLLKKVSNIVPPKKNYMGNKLFGQMIRDLLLSQ